MKFLKQILTSLSQTLFSFGKQIQRHKEKNDANYSDYCANLTNESWDKFNNLLENTLEKGNASDFFPRKDVDLKKEVDKIIGNNGERLIPKIKGSSLKGIVFFSHLAEMPTKGALKIDCDKNKGVSLGLYTSSPTSISFFQTPTGGLAISIRPPQTDGLMSNDPKVIPYKLFRRINDVTEFDLFRALKFFMTCSEEKSLWGKPTIYGQIEYFWITKYRSKIFSKVLAILEEMLLSKFRGAS